MTDPLRTPADLAAQTGIPLATIYGWRSKRTGPRGIRVGRHVRYRQSDIDAWLESCADYLPPRRSPSRGDA